MQLTLLTVSLLATLAVALPPFTQPPAFDWLDAKVPDCGRDCLNEGYKSVGCDIKDYKCRCDRGGELFIATSNPTLHCIDTHCNNQEHERLNAAYEIICLELAWGNTTWFNRTFVLPQILVDP
ncbi:hypothetical protein F5Y08DRAFT_299221 [Xylaria arbuscula]|nr:hypothetical protein F5Y08DRAFT_299221 [Xylaria arbuscula]